LLNILLKKTADEIENSAIPSAQEIIY